MRNRDLPILPLEDFRRTMESCNHCGQCKWLLGPKTQGYDFAEICPIHQRFGFDAYSGQGLLNIAEELLNGELAYERGLIELIYSCTTCGACDINCKSIRDMEVLETILALRARVVADGWGPMPAHQQQARSVAERHNIYGQEHGRRLDWLTPDINLSKATNVAYFAGCAAAYRYPQIAQNTAKILNAGGVKFTVLHAEEYCCGGPLWRTGQVAEARKAAEHNLAALEKQGIDTVITSCAECFGAFRDFYPRLGEMKFRVTHITEVVQQLIAQGRLTFHNTGSRKVTYHDPCLLGRLSEPFVPWNGEIKAFGRHEPPKQWRRGAQGVYDAPREVLKAIPGLEVVEMVRNEENSYCCGAGGGVAEAFPEFSQWTANERCREAESTGAGAIVSCCPFCQGAFETAPGAPNGEMKYFDITQLIADAL
jgi:Fe-S oxidoreductase